MTDDLIKHNYHYWVPENSRCFCEILYQHQWSINVWCCIVNGTLLDYIFLMVHLQVPCTMIFFKILSQLSEHVDLAIRQRLWMQQDGAPSHYAHNLRNILNQIFPNCWIGRDDPVSRPFRSP